MNGENKNFDLENKEFDATDSQQAGQSESTQQIVQSENTQESTLQTEQIASAQENTQNQDTSQIPVTEPVQSGYSVTAQSQMNNGYNFWQHQAGGNYYENPSQNYQQAYSNMAYTPNPPKKKKEHKLLKKVGKSALAGMVAAAGFCVVVFGANQIGMINQEDIQKVSSDRNTLTPTKVTSGGAIQTEKDLTAVVKKCMPSIVSINSTVTSQVNSFYGTYDQDEVGSGSGIILKMSEDEILIVTNNHVIADAKKIAVGFYGTTSEKDMVEAVVKGTDSTKDLAVVLVKTKDVPKDILNNIAAIELGSSEDTQVGQLAIAIGNALGNGQSMTVGYISAKDREVAVDTETTMTLLQTDAAINPGNSGGALLNAQGQLIGINSAKYSDTTVEGMGFAIPISDAIATINDLMEREVLSEEEKGYLGIKGLTITEEDQAKYQNMPLGIYVSEISEDGAAADADLVVGDIIVGVDDEEILSIEALAEKVNSYRIGTTITLKVKRYNNGTYEDKKIKVKLKGKETLDSMEDSASNGQSQQNQQRQQDDSQQNGLDQNDPYGDYFGNDEDVYNYFFGN